MYERKRNRLGCFQQIEFGSAWAVFLTITTVNFHLTKTHKVRDVEFRLHLSKASLRFC